MVGRGLENVNFQKGDTNMNNMHFKFYDFKIQEFLSQWNFGGFILILVFTFGPKPKLSSDQADIWIL